MLTGRVAFESSSFNCPVEGDLRMHTDDAGNAYWILDVRTYHACPLIVGSFR